jgi:hypothetical protein
MITIPLVGTISINSECPNGGVIPPDRKTPGGTQAQMTYDAKGQPAHLRISSSRACTCALGSHLVVVDLDVTPA